MKQYDNYADLITFTRASSGTALRPISYGDELVVNGDFSYDGDWTKLAGWTISGGTLIATLASGDTSTYQDFATVVGKTYTASIDCSAITGGAFRFYYRIVGGAYQNYADIVAGETTSFTFTASTTSSRISVYAFGTSSGVFDNISVREVLFDQPNGTLTLFNHPTNVPRIEYDSDGNRLGLLVEEARTNLVTYSDFASDIFAYDLTVSTNQAVSPDGTENATELTETATNNYHRVYSDTAITGTANSDHTFSAYVKRGSGTRDIQLRAFYLGTGAPYVNFDLGDGTVGASSGASGTSTLSTWTLTNTNIQEVGNGWYRISATVNASNDFAFGFVLIDDASTAIELEVYQGDGTSSVFVYGAQFEAGSFPTSYIPSNSGSTTTRSADVASIGVSEFGFNSAEGSVVCDIASKNGTATAVYYIGDGTQNNRIMTYAGDASHLIVRASNVEQANIDAGTYTQDKLAATYKQNDFAVSINGGAVVTDTSGDIPSTSIMYIGSNNGSLYYLNGHLKSLRYFPRRLTNAQLQELTS